jgi:ABC-type transport system substrate-binding protein
MYVVPGDDYSFVICLDKAYSFLNDDGTLSVWSAYYMSGLPLVKESLYEDCKTEPALGSTLWTTNYNSTLETTASWGPYKLAEFEAGSHYKLVKNDNWYGYALETNKNQYNVTAINCRKVEEANTVWLGFLAGNYDDASLDTFNVEEYLDSKYVSFSEGSTGTYGMQLFSDLATLKTSNNNNGILAIANFRQAFNLALNRSDVIEKIWPGTTTPCFGLVNVAYYYDVENAATLADGGKYRNSPIAMAGILRAYGYTEAADGTWSINDLTGMTLEDAYETLTGYNFSLAREKMAAAIADLEANAEYYGYDSSKDITLVYGSSADTDKQRFRATYLQEVLDSLVAGTSLQGKIKVVFDASAGSQWAEAFRSGATQIGFGYGFQGNAFNPFSIIGAFVDPKDDLNYHMYWDTSAINITLTMPAGNYAGAGQTLTMSAQNWYYCLNGIAAENNAPVQYNWDAGFAPTEARLMILSALEELVIKESRSIMLIADSGGSFLSAKFSQLTDSYNTFMGFGGLRYMVVEYTDAEWKAYVESMSGDLSSEYKKSE